MLKTRRDVAVQPILREWLIERKADALAAWGTAIPWREPPELREIKSLAELPGVESRR